MWEAVTGVIMYRLLLQASRPALATLLPGTTGLLHSGGSSGTRDRREPATALLRCTLGFDLVWVHLSDILCSIESRTRPLASASLPHMVLCSAINCCRNLVSLR
jgi:hypothetical protein